MTDDVPCCRYTGWDRYWEAPLQASYTSTSSTPTVCHDRERIQWTEVSEVSGWIVDLVIPTTRFWFAFIYSINLYLFFSQS